jgi:hypothetical protein
MASAFIAYSWETDEHRAWVLALATRLRGDGIETVLDQWHVVPGDQLPAFMEKAVRESDYVLIICTPRYKAGSDRREGGVGYEGDIITGEVLNTRNQRKFIPILRVGDWNASAPIWLAGKCHIDLRGEPYKENQYQDLLTTLLGTRAQPPPIRGAGAHAAPATAQARVDQPDTSSACAEGFEPIQIAGIVVDEIGTPTGDGTRGSALYSVPFRLTRKPPREWAEFFVRAWDSPSSYTGEHRRGIASVYGDKVVLNRTTLEEVEKDHRDTLLLAAKVANAEYAELRARRLAEEARKRARLEAHKKSVEDTAKRIKF